MNKAEEKLKQAELERQKAAEVQFWTPKEGEVLTGVVEDLHTLITIWGEKKVMRVVSKNGTYLVFRNAILDDLIAKHNVTKGTRVAIKFLGLKKAKRGKKYYKDFVLVTLDEDTDNTSANVTE